MTMTKIMLFLAMILLMTQPYFVYAQDAKPVDWDKMEAQFYSDLKATQGNHTEAGLEQALGYMLLKKDQWERAAIHYKKAVKLDPTLFNSWYNLGIIYIDKEEGNEDFRRAIKANPDYPPPYYWLAYNYCKARKDKEAISIFEKYIKVATKSSDSNEADRIDFAKKLLKELYSGKGGEDLKEIRE
jgi:tetratricopeptide (TPR) repeat protein